MTSGVMDVCVVGLGPAGLAATLELSEAVPRLRVACFEAGPQAKDQFCTILQGKGCRKADPCHVISGVGGSAILSGGKISEYPAGRALQPYPPPHLELEKELASSLARLEEFVPLQRTAAPPELRMAEAALYADRGFDFRYYPAHLYRQADFIAGCDRMVDHINAAGIQTFVSTRVIQIRPAAGGGWWLRTAGPAGDQVFESKYVVLATGRLGAPLIQELRAVGLELESNQPDLGVRLEFPTEAWPNASSCHNDLKLHFGRARTFCVCAGGYLAPYRWKHGFFLEGYSDPQNPSAYTNLGITVRLDRVGLDEILRLEEDIQRRTARISGGMPVRQMLGDFLGSGKRSTFQDRSGSSIRYWQWGDVSACFPTHVADEIRQAVRTFSEAFFPPDGAESVSVFAPEADYLWASVPLKSDFESFLPGLFVAGEGTGHFRGILQAFLSGQRAARAIRIQSGE